MNLKIYNTLTKQKENFTPIESGKIRMFVCGPTVYDVSHIGHAKTYIQFDFIARYLRAQGADVDYLQNITDIDDKIIKRANELKITPHALALKYEKLFLKDMERLGITSVNRYARATDHIEAIIRQVQQLIDKGFAYRLDDGWYLDTSKLEEYGKLAGRSNILNEDAISTIDDTANKKQAADFALWKFHKPGEPSWQTHLGTGRPGWHIEDTAITETVFGPQYDLHGGAVDLIFPHHENEIAQMESASGLKPMVRYWMHTGLVRVGKAKMGKSNNNFITIDSVLQNTHMLNLRYLFLSHHYRSSATLNDDSISNARLARLRVENFYSRIRHSGSETPHMQSTLQAYKQRFYSHMDDDFDTPGALAVIFELIREFNRTDSGGTLTAEFLDCVNNIFGIFEFSEQEAYLDKETLQSLREREALRLEGKFKEADIIRDNLADKGITLRDTPNGTVWFKN